MNLNQFIKKWVLRPLLFTRHGYVLTFDDGPTFYTRTVLQELDKHKVKAIFFIIGQHANDNLQILNEISAAGHLIGNHSYTHPFIEQLTVRELFREFDTVDQLLQRSGFPATTVLRPPRGKVTLSLLIYCLVRRKRLLFWDLDPRDFAATSSDQIVRYFDDVVVHKNDVILLHDRNPHTVKALPTLLSKIRS